MAENQALNAFLEKEGGAAPPEPAQPAPEPRAPATPPAEPKAPAATPAPAAKAPEAKPDDDDEHDPPFTGGDNRTVPFSALEKVRNDWKSKHAAEHARAELLAKQIEELKRPPVQPAQQQPPQPALPPLPDFNTDPLGYTHALAERNAAANHANLLNDRLNFSEIMLREKIGEEAVAQYVKDFQTYAQNDRALWDKLYVQPAPYQWMTKEIDRLRHLNEIGDDVSAYRTKLIAEERAKWEAERAQSQPAVSPAAGLPPSLANARSVAGRSAPVWTGEPSLDDVVRGIPSHVRAQRGRS